MLIISLAACLMAASAMAQYEKRDTDTLWLDTLRTHSDQQVMMHIYFTNATPVTAIDVPLKYDYPDLMIDSISFAGSRIPSFYLLFGEIDSANAELHIGAIYFDVGNPIPIGTGLLATIFVNIPDEYPDREITFDTTHITTSLTFVDDQNIWYTPQFIPGFIDNSFAPSLTDSLWIESVESVPGAQFEMLVNYHNELPASIIQLPLAYESDNIIFDSAVTTGYRAETVQSLDVFSDDSQKKLLLNLDFGDLSPLSPGEGPLINLYFSVSVLGSTTLAMLDTTQYGGGFYHIKLGPLFGGLIGYPDFTPGEITINIATDAGDETDALPLVFNLDQNHPNPFNPTTKIGFTLPQSGHVKLEVFNVLGQTVRVLVDGDMTAGAHEIIFDGRDGRDYQLASGVYFYRIKTEQHEASRKMILMK